MYQRRCKGKREGGGRGYFLFQKEEGENFWPEQLFLIDVCIIIIIIIMESKER